MDTGLERWAASRGARIAVGETAALEAVHGEFDALLARRDVDPAFHDRRLSFFRWADLGDPSLRWIVMAAVPRPAHRLVFETALGRIETLVPPTYVGYDRINAELRAAIAASPKGEGARIERLAAPLKTIASRLGLVAYGRNNVTYVPGMGSYFQLAGFLVDADPGVSAGWSPAAARSLPECEYCGACRESCPTGAIPGDRFLLRAERCLALFTESEGAWPPWLDAAAHDCIVGCMRCQEACPLNAGLLAVEDAGVSFDERETAAVLRGGGERGGAAWDSVRKKLAALEMADYEPMLGRNLAALVGRGPLLL